MKSWVSAMRAGRHAEAHAIAAASRTERDPATRDDPRLPYHLRWLWDGRSPDGADVLVRCYHGLGDTIQYARFLPALAARAATVTVEAQPRLIPLLGPAFTMVRFRPFDPARPLSPAEVDIGITELDGALGLAPDAPPAPYLKVMSTALPAGAIALCHASGDWDPDRSLSPDLLAPLCRHAPCVTLVPGPSTLAVLNPEGCPLDMAATAGLVAGAVLVVTVDTMIAHLAGALGRPTLLLLKADPDWRWTPGARRSCWYPTMRLYHQPRPGDWASMMAEMERDVATFAAREAA